MSRTFSNLILQVVCCEVKFCQPEFGYFTFKNGRDSNPHVSMQFTCLCLCGDGNKITVFGWVTLRMTHKLRMLNSGDLIKLHLLTELTYQIGDNGPVILVSDLFCYHLNKAILLSAPPLNLIKHNLIQQQSMQTMNMRAIPKELFKSRICLLYVAPAHCLTK